MERGGSLTEVPALAMLDPESRHGKDPATPAFLARTEELLLRAMTNLDEV